MPVSGKKVIVAGASGLVGNAIVRQYAAAGDCEIVALARTRPRELYGAVFESVDLTSPEACDSVARRHPDASHFAYAATHELPSLAAGWTDPGQIAINVNMFANIARAVTRHAPGLEHVMMMEGAKAYGTHVARISNPAREDRSETPHIPVFYWGQEEVLFELANTADWAWTILRPPAIFGVTSGANNAITAVGAYAAIAREEGKTKLLFPGGEQRIAQAIDVDILGRAVVWAGEAETARNEKFNIANGDVYSWWDVWPAVCDALGMEPGEFSREDSLAVLMEGKAEVWDRVRERHGLAAPPLEEFVRTSFQVFDFFARFGETEPVTALLSTVKLHRAGFREEIDTEVMFRNIFRRLQDDGLLPRV